MLVSNIPTYSPTPVPFLEHTPNDDALAATTDITSYSYSDISNKADSTFIVNGVPHAPYSFSINEDFTGEFAKFNIISAFNDSIVPEILAEEPLSKVSLQSIPVEAIFQPPVKSLSSADLKRIMLMKNRSSFYVDHIAYLSTLNLLPEEFSNERANTASLIKYAITSDSHIEAKAKHFIDIDPQKSSLKDLDTGLELLDEVTIVNKVLKQSATGASAHFGAIIGTIMIVLKVLVRKHKQGGWQNWLKKNGVKIKKKSLTKYMGIATIDNVEQWVFLGVDRLYSLRGYLKSLKITGKDPIQTFYQQYALNPNAPFTEKRFKRELDCIRFKMDLNNRNISYNIQYINDLLETAFSFTSRDLRRLTDIAQGQDNINEQLTIIFANKGKWPKDDDINDKEVRHTSINSLTSSLCDNLKKQLMIPTTETSFDPTILAPLERLIIEINKLYNQNPLQQIK